MSQPLSEAEQNALDAAVLRRLIAHLDSRKDVQNIELMNLAGFCRNCLSKWYAAAAKDSGLEVSDESAREHIYGMPYADWKRLHQKDATPQQQAAFAKSKPE
jgi:hypothetical protein